MSNEDFRRVKERISLYQVAREYLGRPERDSQHEAWWPCPLHEETEASFHVKKKEGYWKCFGCDQGGDVFDLLQAVKGCNEAEALEILARKAGVSLDDDDAGGARDSAPRQPQQPSIERVPRSEAIWAARVEFPDGDAHVVQMTQSGSVVCDCKGYRYRQDCRHRDLAIERYGAPRAPSGQDTSPDDNDDQEEGATPRDITVQELAADKGLPAQLLHDLGCENRSGDVVIPYHLPDGSRAPRPRLRTALSGSDGSRWLGDTDDAIVPYGLSRLDEARSANRLHLVEGESDAWTLWHAGEPALGVPGASQAGKISAEDLARIQSIYIVREPDQGGDTFVRGVAERLVELQYGGEAWVMDCGRAEDPNDAWQRCDDDIETFRSAWERHRCEAEPLAWPISDAEMWEPRNISRAFLREANQGVGSAARRGTELRFWRDSWWVWNGQHYRKISAAELRGHLAAFIEGRKWEDTRKQSGERITYKEQKSATRATVRNVVQSLEGLCVAGGHHDPPVWSDGSEPAEHLIMENGILYLDDLWALMEDETESVDLEPHTPELFAVNGLPYSWDRNAECPRWEQFLDRVLPNEAKQRVLAQWCGYCLLPTNRYQKIFVMVGEGANGKSVIMDVTRHLVGKSNVSAAPLEQLHQPHALQPLVGKLLNQATEWGYLHQTGLMTLKAVSGGDSVTINPKHKAPYEAVLPVRWMVSTNEVPQVQDRSEAIWRRLMLMEFEEQIPPDEQIPKERFVDMLCEELPGILIWALCGLKDLEDQGGFEIPDCMAKSAREMREKSNPAASWCEQSLVVAKNAELNLRSAYADYKSYCNNGGWKPLNRANFSKQIRRWFHRETGRKVTSERRRIEGKRQRFYQGCRMAIEGVE